MSTKETFYQAGFKAGVEFANLGEIRRVTITPEETLTPQQIKQKMYNLRYQAKKKAAKMRLLKKGLSGDIIPVHVK